MDSENAMFKASIVNVAGGCGQKVVGVCHSSILRTQWWTREVREELKLVFNLLKLSHITPFFCNAPQWWNELPMDMKTAETLNIFHCRLKPHLFRLYLVPKVIFKTYIFFLLSF